MPTKYLYRGDLALHYEHTGSTTLPGVAPSLDQGECVVFVHGGGGNGRLWARQLAQLSEKHSPLAFDLPAHGRSGGLDAAGSVRAAAEILADALTALNAPPAVLVGHGLGGQIGLQLALDHRARVKALVTLATSAGPAAGGEEKDILRDVVRGRRPQSFDTPWFSSEPDMGIIREVWGEIVKTDPRVRLQDLEMYESSDLRPRLSELEVPTLVLHGAEDRYCLPKHAEEMAAQIQNARVEMIDKAGHFPQLEQADRVHELVGEFLR